MGLKSAHAAIFALGVLFLGRFMGADPPREHFAFASRTGEKIALPSHSSLRDSSDTKVTFKDKGCCTRYIAYKYQGDGDDYMGARLRQVD